MIELTATAAVEEFFVAGVWIADPAGSWTASSEQGSRLLGLDAEQVRALGGAGALEARLRERSDADWKAGLQPAKARSGDGGSTGE